MKHVKHMKDHEMYKAEVLTREIVSIKPGQKILASVLSSKQSVTPATYCLDCHMIMMKK